MKQLFGPVHFGSDQEPGIRRRGSTRFTYVDDRTKRFSGDEFVVLCEDLSSAADVDGLAKRINDAMAKPFKLADAQVTITGSIGIAFAGPGQDISTDLVVEADRAMYAVKHKGRNGHKIVDVRPGVLSH